VTTADPDLGYYRHPTLRGDAAVFVAEDDLWSVSLAGGGPLVARRLTRGQGRASDPVLSPDGEWIVYTARDEGNAEIAVMNARGGVPRRLTFQGAVPRAVGWSDDSATIHYVSGAQQPFGRSQALFSIDVSGGEPRRQDLGPVTAWSRSAAGRVAIGWYQDDAARWKRYRGGRAGVIWVDDGAGEFTRPLDLAGNLARPMWVGERLLFLSDHEGVANLYSCAPDGSALKRETEHREFFARWPRTDGERVLYTAGADLWLLTPGRGASKLDVTVPGAGGRRARKFERAVRWTQSAYLNPEGHSLALTVRGQPVVTGLWEGPVRSLGAGHGVRYRLTQFLPDDYGPGATSSALIAVADRPGEEEALEVLPLDAAVGGDGARFPKLDIGRALAMAVSPAGDRVAITNHRQELLVISLKTRGGPTLRKLDHSPFGRLAGVAWSPDGRWLAWSKPDSPTTTSLYLAAAAGRGEAGKPHRVTGPEFRDIQPCFDSKGRYLYFLSYREFNPVFDAQVFDYGFPRSMRLCLVTLKADTPDPFLPLPRPLEPPKKGKEVKIKVEVDLEGIADRVVRFPIGAGSFGRIGSCGDRVFYTSFPVRGMKGRSWQTEDRSANAALRVFDLDKREDSALLAGISDFRVGQDYKTLLISAGLRRRVIQASLKSDKEKAGKAGRKSGWLDLNRVSVEVEPSQEWSQMLREAWRLMRDHFWTANMSGVDWGAAWERYSPLLARVGSRSEFSDLVWEMQGELGTSHAYEMGGDYSAPPSWRLGFLGADLAQAEATDTSPAGARIVTRLRGDPWDPLGASPLSRPGVDARPGDIIVAVDGRGVTPERPASSLLVNRSGRVVSLTLHRPGAEAPHEVTVAALRSDAPLRYRDWVNQNRARVHEATDGEVGYIHIPDMGANGFAEFHRAARTELNRPGLVVDVRYNRGGHVSGLLLQVLARPRLGYKVSRWGQPWSYPREAPFGPMVALTNAFAGSDGDIFTHGFKLMKLGPVVGTRTWGGVVGIWPRHRLLDGAVTSQPEFANWFVDAGWSVEGGGTLPDVEVEIRPQDFAAGSDPQLDEALRLIREQVAAAPGVPDFDGRPHFGPPYDIDSGNDGGNDSDA